MVPSSRLMRTGAKGARGASSPSLLFLVTGLILSSFVCTCEAEIPHVDYLFASPSQHHNHGGRAAPPAHEEKAHLSSATPAHVSHPAMIGNPDPECDLPRQFYDLSEAFTLASMNDHQESAVVHVPLLSSIGQPMAMAHLGFDVTTIDESGEPVDGPIARHLEGMEHSPETPPPRA